MAWIKRDESGRVVAVSEEPLPGFQPLRAPADMDVASFMARVEQVQQALVESDSEFVRVIEDLVTVLVEQNQIRFTDLPEVAQRKMLDRQQLRQSMHSTLQLLPDDDSDEVI